MAALKDQDLAVLGRYSRAVMHMRDRQRVSRLALGLGAGVSLDLGFPSWKQLVERLAQHPDFVGASIPEDASLTVKTQALTQQLENTAGRRFAASAEAERKVRYRWIQALHKVLYDQVPRDASQLSQCIPI